MAIATSTIVALAITAASAAYQAKQQSKARKKMRAKEEAAKGFDIVTEMQAADLPIAYGRNMIGGLRVFSATSKHFEYTLPNADKSFVVGPDGQPETSVTGWNFNPGTNSFESVDIVLKATAGGQLTTTSSGEYRSYLFVQQALCAGPINGVVDLVFDESRYTDDPSLASTEGGKELWNRNNKEKASYRVDVHNGNGSQPDSIISANFPKRATAGFPNIAYLSAVIRLDRDDPQFQGVPDIQCMLEGRLVPYVAGGTLAKGANGLLRRYSANPAMCLLDYLMDKEMGLGLELFEIDEPSFVASAAVCDKIVMRGAAVGGRFWRGRASQRDIPLYECNITIDTSRAIRDNIEEILATMGDARLVWSQGKYKLLAQYPESNDQIVLAGVLTDDDLALGESFAVNEPTTDERLNHQIVTYRDESNNFKEYSASWPPKESGTIYTKIGGRSYPHGTGTWNAVGDAEALLQRCAIWNGAGNTAQVQWKVLFEKAGRYEFRFVLDDSGTVTIGGTTIGLTWPEVKSHVVNVAAGAIIDVSAVCDNWGWSKGIGIEAYDGNNTRVWDSRGPSYDRIEAKQVTSAVYDAFLAEDYGMPLERSSSYEGIKDYYHALAKAEELVRMSRTASSVQFKIFMNDRIFEPGDYVRIDSPTLEVGGLYVRIDEVRVVENNLLDIKGARFDWTQLAWNVEDDQVIPPDDIYGSSVQSPLWIEYNNGVITWGLSPDTRVADYVLYAYGAGEEDAEGYPRFREIGVQAAPPFVVPDIGYMAAFFGVRARTGSGGLSGMVTTASIQLNSAPPVVSQLFISEKVQFDEIQLSARFLVSNPFKYAEIWCGKEGAELQLVATTDNTGAIWKVPEGGTYVIEVRPFGPELQGPTVTQIYTTGTSAVPAAPGSLVARGIIFGIELEWTYPQNSLVSHIEIWYSTQTDREQAVRLGQYSAPTTRTTITGLPAAYTLFFWARAVDFNGVYGDWFPLTGYVEASTSSDARAILDYLADQITRSELSAPLLSELDKLEDLEIDYGNIIDELGRLDGEIASLMGAGEYDPEREYTRGSLIVDNGKMYRAKIDVPIEMPPPQDTYWEYIGDYATTGDAISALFVRMNNVEANGVTSIEYLLSENRRREDDDWNSVAGQLFAFDSRALIRRESEVRTGENEALARSITEWGAWTGDAIAAAVREERTAWTTATQALASSIDQLRVEFSEDINAAILSERTITANEISALGTTIDAMRVQFDQDITAAVESESQARTTAIAAEASARNSLRTELNGNISSLRNDYNATSGPQGTLTQSVSQLTASTNNLSATVSTQASAIANLDGKVNATYTVKVATTSGTAANRRTHVAGFSLGVGGPDEGSQFLVLADKFALLHQNVASGAITTPFVVTSAGQVILNELIADRISVKTLMIDNNAVTVPVSAQVVTVNTGLQFAPDSAWPAIDISLPLSDIPPGTPVHVSGRIQFKIEGISGMAAGYLAHMSASLASRSTTDVSGYFTLIPNAGCTVEEGGIYTLPISGALTYDQYADTAQGRVYLILRMFTSPVGLRNWAASVTCQGRTLVIQAIKR